MCVFSSLRNRLLSSSPVSMSLYYKSLEIRSVESTHIENFDTGKAVLKGLDDLVLPSFGYPPHMHLTLPVSLVPMHVCTVCGRPAA